MRKSKEHPKRHLALVALACLTLISSAAAATTTSASGHTAFVVKMNLGLKAVQTKYGKLQGYDPVVLTMHVGDTVRWKNVDSVVHTASTAAKARAIKRRFTMGRSL